MPAVGSSSSSGVLRALGPSVAILLQLASAACVDEPSAPDSDDTPSHEAVVSLAHGRVLEAGESHPLVGRYQVNGSAITALPARLRHLKSVAVDPTTGHVHVLDHVAQLLHEVSETGRVVATRDVSKLQLVEPQAMSFAPSADLTDDPSEMALYIAAGERVIEVSLDQPVTLAAATTTAVLARTTQTSSYSPPSPDPSGIAYVTHLGRLVIGDGEVNEMPIYAGANMFEATLTGSLTGTWTTLAFSGEPTGVAYNPANRHLFVSDDDDRQIYEVDPGADGRYGTSDDRRTSFDTQVFGSTDPEGLAYDPLQRVLFIADGVNAQVYRVAPGPNGVFDGVAPAGDDQVTSFDTQAHGLTDPEGIAYDSDLRQLYVVGNPESLVFQFSSTGALLGTIDISAAQADKPAGLEYVSGSVSSGAPMLYVVDRGVDNDSDPRENDGKLYQFSLPSAPGNTQPSVTITAPSNGSTFTQGNTVTFTGTASDAEDGNLTAGLRWTSSLNGTLGSGGTVSTSALSVGTHTITASVTDAGGTQGFATIAVTVNPTGSGTAVQVRVSASGDDAEESASGSVSLTSSDLELVLDGSDQQVVGMRFNGVTVPPGATIIRAYVQFQVDEVTSDATSLVVAGEATDNAAAFTSTSRNISSRARTGSAVAWSPAPWPTVDEAGANQQTPNLASIVQEIVNRSGWRSGNALALIVTGTGKRVAEAYDGVPAAAPLLRVEYSSGPNTAPAASNVTISGTAEVGRVLTGNYTYSDANGDAEGASSYRWLRDGAAIGGATARTYTLVAADQGSLIRFEVTPVATSGASPGTPVQSAAVGPVAAPQPNSAPVATNVAISGTAEVGAALTGNYTYGDADGDVEGSSTYRWLRNGSPIAGATSRSYTLVLADQGTLIVFEVTPAAATGTSPGAPVPSTAAGPVAPFGAARIAASSDDAEESSTGKMNLTRSGLEIVLHKDDIQTIGLRFNGVWIPRGATITRAYVQFRVQKATTVATSLVIHGQAVDNAATFSTASHDISSRGRTASAVAWSPPPWATVGQVGADQQTSDLASILQEIVNRPGWQAGNSLALIITGTGRRIATAYNGSPGAAPLLRVEFSTGSSP